MQYSERKLQNFPSHGSESLAYDVQRTACCMATDLYDYSPITLFSGQTLAKSVSEQGSTIVVCVSIC